MELRLFDSFLLLRKRITAPSNYFAFRDGDDDGDDVDVDGDDYNDDEDDDNDTRGTANRIKTNSQIAREGIRRSRRMRRRVFANE